jgi:hypothetical protein
MTYILSALTLILQLIEDVNNNTTAIGKIIAWLEQIVPLIITEVKTVLPMVQNVIDALKNSDAITPEQFDALDKLEAQTDAAFEAAAKASGAPDDTTA